MLLQVPTYAVLLLKLIANMVVIRHVVEKMTGQLTPWGMDTELVIY